MHIQTHILTVIFQLNLGCLHFPHLFVSKTKWCIHSRQYHLIKYSSKK